MHMGFLVFWIKNRTETGRFGPVSGLFFYRFGCYFWVKTEPNRKWSPLIVSDNIGLNLIFIGSTRRSNLHPQIRIEFWMGQRIVPISLPQPAIIGLLKIKKSNHHIQFNKNNNLQNKIVEQTYHEVLSMVVNELLRPFWRSWLRTCVSTNSSIGLGSRPRDIAYNEKILINKKLI